MEDFKVGDRVVFTLSKNEKSGAIIRIEKERIAKYEYIKKFVVKVDKKFDFGFDLAFEKEEIRQEGKTK